MQVWHGTHFWITTFREPYGCHLPRICQNENNETHGVPTAAARCCTPESRQIASSQCRSTSVDSITDISPAKECVRRPTCAASARHISSSSFPPTSKTVKPWSDSC